MTKKQLYSRLVSSLVEMSVRQRKNNAKDEDVRASVTSASPPTLLMLDLKTDLSNLLVLRTHLQLQALRELTFLNFLERKRTRMGTLSSIPEEPVEPLGKRFPCVEPRVLLAQRQQQVRGVRLFLDLQTGMQILCPASQEVLRRSETSVEE